MDITRRDFLTLTGGTALGFAAGYTLPGPIVRSLAAGTAKAPIALGTMSLVSVAASKNVRAYGRAPTRLRRFSGEDWRYAATGVLWKAIAGLADDGDPIAYLKTLVHPGGTVLIKPNWVEPSYWYNGKITHPTLVWQMAAMAAAALGPSGHVLVAEGTAEASDWGPIVRYTGSDHTVAGQRANGLPVRLVDLDAARNRRLSVYLGRLSRFASSGAVYFDAHSGRMGRMGDGRVGRYLIARPVIDADLVIDFAKAKIHCSAGVTLGLKNFLGIVPANDGPYGDNASKDVPHSSAAERAEGHVLVANRTLGYSMADLAAVTTYVARDGSVQRKAQRNVLYVVDGIVSGGNYQHNPTPKLTGWVAASRDPVALDHVGTRCLGFDVGKVLSLTPAERGTLYLGTANPPRLAVAYNGPGSFGGYFTIARKVRAEQVKAHWGGLIDLGRYTVGAYTLLRPDADTVELRAAKVTAARVEYSAGGLRWAARLSLVRTGVWRGTIPAGAEHPRLVAFDSHLNMLTRVL
jgi:uncharacterized protein (DUF362 family)